MSEAHKTFVGVDGVARVYRQTFIPFDDSNDLLFDVMDAFSASVAKIPKKYIEKLMGDDVDPTQGVDLDMSDVDPRDIVEVVSVFARHIRQFGKPSEFFARIFVATQRQLAPPSKVMQNLGDKAARDVAFAGSIMEAWKVAFWVVWHNYSPFLTEVMMHVGISSMDFTAPSTSDPPPKKSENIARPLSAAPPS